MVVYTDTSVIGGCFDPEFMEHSQALFKEFKTGLKILQLSDLVLLELQEAGKDVMAQLAEVPRCYKIEVKSTVKAVRLAKTYIAEGALSNKSYNDALHIALATLHSADVLASWNFKHIVNLDRIKLYNAINTRMGYRIIEIRTPREILKSV
ncbi:type II toxin-antitoxin system VapC family toxin [Chitinophaga agrisoli]|uniref:Type II toxin-antitoxin system VapC family toxin n=1 Tax=Chitinophaga agrisoli TaxID=2607653 RepID=A0A5B2VLC4_9BACT|nr:type II toxin-antitoxin system VapC family toxin [Chitinophaga agrisoli]KAA2239112.1 type II toxin-antitoxin system VapC family toxin [Chitinophaga agrisoli]